MKARLSPTAAGDAWSAALLHERMGGWRLPQVSFWARGHAIGLPTGAVREDRQATLGGKQAAPCSLRSLIVATVSGTEFLL